jgi:proteasome lid subunit RPN8/RPN11
MPTTIRASARPEVKLRFGRRQWHALITELAARGNGQRESGAFFLGRAGDKRHRVRHIVYLDDLDPNCLTGGITFDGSAYSKLWDMCDELDLQVIGDAHTHPQDWVAQSDIDANNPMLAKAGHVAIIVPHFAAGHPTARNLGVHEYGADGWTSWFRKDAGRTVRIDWWRQ